MAEEVAQASNLEKASEALHRGIDSFSGKHILLLQGPLGPFFRRLSHDLTAGGARVTKVNFNGGDWLFYPTGAIQFKGRIEEWPSFLVTLLAELKIDVILLFGDCRPIHHCVREMAERLGVQLGVFEEGYVRPDHITLEGGGINAYSTLPRDKNFYLAYPVEQSSEPLKVGHVFWYAALWAILYYLASSLLKPAFPHYHHHRRLAVREMFPWLRGLWRKGYYRIKERHVQNRLVTEYSGRFFLVPLQVYYDAQIRVHSNYPSIESFIHEVVSSFAKHADQDLALVIKHHPMDRAYRDYTQLWESLSEGYGLQGRLLYVHDLHLPDVLPHARGVVVVNSTVGLSALLYGVPVKVCGRAIYDIPTITYSGRLKDFWKEAPLHKPDSTALQGFRAYLIEHTQLNGSMYKRLPVDGSRAGVVWSPALSLLSVLTGKKTGTNHGDMRLDNNGRPYKELDAAVVRPPKIRTTFYP
jgi:capsular polysaccharide export protein